ncbi:orotidine-5'-phosphate decarboxylase [Candidatus Roizmanbacteria bacterium]|nr:orotidine-5'-phosphate decarboxylase [Candidatus Roizmanbacteria bacterium]
MSFQQKLDAVVEKNNSLLCVGLDPDFDQMPERFRKTIHPQFTFNKWIIDQTHDLVCCFKPNSAFYEARGVEGIAELKATCDYIREKRPHIPIILDFKRGDIGNTNNGHVQFAFHYLKADAVTVNPYLGLDALQPFLDQRDKGIFVLCKTSNSGSGEFQNLRIGKMRHEELIEGPTTLYSQIAEQVSSKWNKNNNCMLVVGATYPEELKRVRKIVDDMTILSPGVGNQEGELEKTIKGGINSQKKGLIINASRSVIFNENPRQEALKLRDQINLHRSA